jgi:integrase
VGDILGDPPAIELLELRDLDLREHLMQTHGALRIVSELLRHSSTRITADTYSHVAPSLDAAAVEDLARSVLEG